MKTLHGFSGSPFDNPKISLQHLMAFTTDHYQRMRGKNPEGTGLSARIAATKIVIDDANTSFSNDLTQLGQRKSKKLIKRRFRTRLRNESGRVVAYLIATYGSDSPKIKKVIPQGRTIFNTCTDDTLGDHLEVMLNGIISLEADLGTEFGAKAVALATELHDSWKEIHRESEEATGKKSATERRKNEARDAVSWALWENVMAISALFPRQPEKMKFYFRESLLGL